MMMMMMVLMMMMVVVVVVMLMMMMMIAMGFYDCKWSIVILITSQYNLFTTLGTCLRPVKP